MSGSVQKPVFQLRKEFSESALVSAADAAPQLDQGNDTEVSVKAEDRDRGATKTLTENDTYLVRKLSCDFPAIRKIDGNEPGVSGMIDTSVQKAVFSDRDNVLLWDVSTSHKSSAVSIRIPLHDEDEPSLQNPPTCLITTPVTDYDSAQEQYMAGDNASQMATVDCGLCIIQKDKGLITYYEDVEAVNNLYPQLSKAMSHSLKINLGNGEVITEVLNLEPAGIAVATSLGAVYFITIRDTIGRPKLQLKQTLIKSYTGFLPQIFRSSSPAEGPVENSHSVVSLKAGPLMGKGERLLYITTKCGDFQIWQLGISSKCFRRINSNIFNKVLESLQDLYPFAYGSLKLLDSHPLFSEDMNVQLFLSTITDNNDAYYIISTVIFDEQFNSFSIFSTYKLNTMIAPVTPNQTKPRILVPTALQNGRSPVSSVFVLFQNCLVVTQISSTLDSNFTLKRKWEDIISFHKSVKVIGFGYSYDCLYVMSNEVGDIVKVELKEVAANTLADDLEETRFVKTHIEQAVYFANTSLNNPVQFNLPPGLSIDSEVIEHDLLLCSNDIFNSTSKFIPSTSANLEQHLNSRINYFRTLFKYIQKNFNYSISPNAKLLLIEKFETMCCALKLLQKLAKVAKTFPKLSETWSAVLSRNNISLSDLIIKDLAKFPLLFIDFIKSVEFLSDSTEFKSAFIDLLVSCFYEAILDDGERAIRYDILDLDAQEVNENGLPWYIDYDILSELNGLFFNYKFSNEDVPTLDTEKKEQFLTLMKIMYYFFNQVKIWVSNSPNVAISSDFEKVNELYKKSHTDWNSSLCEFGYTEQSIAITDFYQDLESLVQTLETVKDRDDLYEQFFQKYEYAFASTLFSYYASMNDLTSLFFRFPNQSPQLIRFFKENPDQYRDISWIKDIFDKDYAKASSDLSQLDLLKNSMEKNQIFMNIAKLSGIVNHTPDKVEQLENIQSQLDLLDGEIDLKRKLRQDDSQISNRYKGTPFNAIFDSINDKLQNGETIPFSQVIDEYTLLDDLDGYASALKLLAFTSRFIEYEIKKFLTATIWRRCILNDKYIVGADKGTELTDSKLYNVLIKFFSDELYRGEVSLPSKTLVADGYIVTDEYLRNTYNEFVDANNVSAIRECFERDISEVSNVSELETILHTIISAANEDTGNRCVVNYDTNTIELN